MSHLPREAHRARANLAQFTFDYSSITAQFQGAQENQDFYRRISNVSSPFHCKLFYPGNRVTWDSRKSLMISQWIGSHIAPPLEMPVLFSWHTVLIRVLSPDSHLWIITLNLDILCSQRHGAAAPANTPVDESFFESRDTWFLSGQLCRHYVRA